jgi:engulfment/cell motility protein 1
MSAYSLMLINSLLSHATDMWWDEFMGELDRLNVRRVVVVRAGPHLCRRRR